MAFKKNINRQKVIVAEVPIGFADLTSGTLTAAIDIPANAVIDDVHFYVDTAWNSVTSDTLIVGDGVDDDRFITAVSIAATGNKVGLTTIKGYKYTATDTIDVKWTGVGTAPSTGAGRLIVEYHVDGRADFIHRGTDNKVGIS